MIDLTLSDDDEDPRPAKRQETSYNTPNSVQDRRNGYRITHSSKTMRAPSANGVYSSLVRPASNSSYNGVQGNFQQSRTGGSNPSSGLPSPRLVPPGGFGSASPVPFSPPHRHLSFSTPGPFPPPRHSLSTASASPYSDAHHGHPSYNGTVNPASTQRNMPGDYQHGQPNNADAAVRQYYLGQHEKLPNPR